MLSLTIDGVVTQKVAFVITQRFQTIQLLLNQALNSVLVMGLEWKQEHQHSGPKKHRSTNVHRPPRLKVGVDGHHRQNHPMMRKKISAMPTPVPRIFE